MARSARLVIPDHPHHVFQRGARRMKIFFKADDHKNWRKMLGRAVRPRPRGRPKAA